jgi:putative ABC transport system ATP-binding protein
MTPVLDVRRVTKVYGEGDTAVHALRGVSLTVQRGEYVAIMGASGSGKSTLMNILGCLDIPTTGRYLLDGLDVSRLGDRQLALVRNRRIGFVFQSFNLIPAHHRTGQCGASAGLRRPAGGGAAGPGPGRAGDGGAGRTGRPRAQPALRRQQQRVAVARALVTAPALVLADEPTGNLDTASTADMLAVLDQLHDSGRTIVLITHENDGRRPRPPAGPVGRRRRGRGRDAMSLVETIRFALRGIGANKLRSGLTVLGILIGVAAVILLVAVGNGSARAIQAQIEGLGTNTLTVTAGNVRQNGVQTRSTALTVDMVSALNDPTPPRTSRARPRSSPARRRSSTRAPTTACRSSSAPTRLRAGLELHLAQGSPFTTDDVDGGRRVVVIGSTVAEALFPTGRRSASRSPPAAACSP